MAGLRVTFFGLKTVNVGLKKVDLFKMRTRQGMLWGGRAGLRFTFFGFFETLEGLKCGSFRKWSSSSGGLWGVRAGPRFTFFGFFATLEGLKSGSFRKWSPSSGELLGGRGGPPVHFFRAGYLQGRGLMVDLFRNGAPGRGAPGRQGRASGSPFSGLIPKCTYFSAFLIFSTPLTDWKSHPALAGPTRA